MIELIRDIFCINKYSVDGESKSGMTGFHQPNISIWEALRLARGSEAVGFKCHIKQMAKDRRA